MHAKRFRRRLYLGLILGSLSLASVPTAFVQAGEADPPIQVELLSGDGIWVQQLEPSLAQAPLVQAKVWFDRQFLGDGTSYRKRAEEFSNTGRRALRQRVIHTLKSVSDQSYLTARGTLDKLVKDGVVRNVQRHWIVNGFSCELAPLSIDALKTVPGVKKVFLTRPAAGRRVLQASKPPAFPTVKRTEFDATRFKHPWYIRYLLADKVWQELGVTGTGTLNVIHDFNFVFSDNTTRNLYHNSAEIPADGIDDDENGLVDDYHGYNFDRNSPALTTQRMTAGRVQPQVLHGFMCSAIVCGAGVTGAEYEFGIAPEASWTGVIGAQQLEAAVEWAIEQGADTYSMSFSIPGLGDYRSHWRKIMEHGSFCGVFFVSGAGNFAQQVATPVQMRIPEDIPDVVFAAAGVQRNFQRTPFSSKGPVRWATEHYHDGLVQKPEVCAFNMALPMLLPDGSVQPSGLNGNSFAGPMFCGAIALMLSADPELLPWDLKQIITSTATDVAAPGVDDETGHGLINCYRAVREVLRRKAIREGTDPKPFEGRQPGDTLDLKAIQAKLKPSRLKVGQVQASSQAALAGIQRGDIVVGYAGKPISSRADLINARRKSPATRENKAVLSIRRNAEKLDFEVGPGQLGFVPVDDFEDPVFQ